MVGKGEASLRELLARLIDHGKAFVQAEIALAKATAKAWAGAIKVAVVLLIAALLLAVAGLVVAVTALGFTLAHWLGPAGGLAVAALIALALAGLCAGLALRRLLALIK